MYTLYSFSCCLKYVNAKFCSVLICIEILQHNKQVKFLWVFLLFSVVWLFCFFFHHPPCKPAEIGFIKMLFCVQYYKNLRVQDTFNFCMAFPPHFSLIQLKTTEAEKYTRETKIIDLLIHSISCWEKWPKKNCLPDFILQVHTVLIRSISWLCQQMYKHSLIPWRA